MPEQKQTEKININLLKKDEEKKYLLHVEEKFVEDIVKKVLDAKLTIAKSEEKNNPHAPTCILKTFICVAVGIVGVALIGSGATILIEKARDFQSITFCLAFIVIGLV